MKPVALATVALGALVGLGAWAVAQGVRPPSLTPSMPWPDGWQTNAIATRLAEPLSPLPAPELLATPVLQVPGLPPAGHHHPPPATPMIPPGFHRGASSNLFVVPSAPPGLRPGVYKTEPYSCIVVVPGPHPDDRSIHNPGDGRFSMPMIRPELRFVPLTQPQK